ncbi:ATP-binding cassette domain-containing protein [Amycolatopsis sp. NPDC001319]|uniref:ATP-binding cassette domain-containing protein n=1 Tax=unclassified Amycolatopsis TaxID=2618356 RepID=UPI0036BC9639
MSTRYRSRAGAEFRQVEESDCGAACLGILLAGFGKYLSWPVLSQACGGGRDGISAATLARRGQQFGLTVSAKRVRLSGAEADVATLRGLAAPGVVFVDNRHFAVLERVGRGGKVRLHDPAAGRHTLSIVEFRERFSGLYLGFRPGAGFEPSGAPQRVLPRALRWLGAGLPVVLGAVVAGVVTAGLTVVAALLARSLVTATAGPGATWWLAAVAVGVALAGWAQQRLVSAALLRTSLRRSTELVGHLLRLPGSYFHRRFTGGVAARVQIADTIAQQLTTVVLPVAVSLAAVIGLLTVLAVLAPPAAALLAGSTLLTALVVRFGRRSGTERQSALMVEQSARDGLSLNVLSAIDTVKAEGSGRQAFGRWSSAQRKVLAAQRRAALGEHGIGLAVTALHALGYAACLALTALVAPGEVITVAVLAGVWQLHAGGLVTGLHRIGGLRSSFAAYDDVAGAETDPSDVDEPVAVGPGRVTVRGLRYGYDTNTEPLLVSLDLDVPPGGRMTLVGPSGCGKSTLAKLLAGLVRPWSGVALVDGRRSADLPPSVRPFLVGYVPQRPAFFEGTVRENLELGTALPDDAIAAALDDAQLTETIELRGGIDAAQVSQQARNFSGGERQRLALARALARNPRVLVLDEATSAVETALAARIDAALRTRGTTTVVVAHRLSEVRGDDTVVLLDHGAVRVYGTHDDLLAHSRGYRDIAEVAG